MMQIGFFANRIFMTILLEKFSQTMVSGFVYYLAVLALA